MQRGIFAMALLMLSSCMDRPCNPLNGIWIEDSYRTSDGSFKTIYFYNDSCFLRVSSTQFIDKDDSVHFRVEPGFIVESGFFECSDGVYNVDYKLIYRTFNIVGDTIPSHNNQSTLVRRGDHLVFDTESFHMSNRYKVKSRREIENMATLIPTLRKIGASD